MTAPTGPAQIPFDRTSRVYHQRWWILGVLCFSLLVIIVDNSILNIAVPTLQKDEPVGLGATNSQMQWVIDSYTLVFAGLLLTAGTLGDRFGRRGALQVGMAVFGAGSLLSAFADSANQLIFTRGLMGIGAAFIMPATLSIISNTFPPEEPGRAIAFWATIAGVAVALGPISGGLLLEHFYWGSIFLVNLPIVAFALGAGFFLIPTSKDPTHTNVDVVGAALSIVGLIALVYAIIEGPEAGWGSPKTVGAFAIAAVVLGVFAWWESHVAHPMLDTNFFKNPRFTATSTGITLIFFAMFGSMFLLTQYMQFVMEYSPLQAGVRLLPMAATMLVVAPMSARIVERVGTKIVVTTGLMLASLALLSYAWLPAQNVSYPGDVMWRMMIMACGMALVMAPSTESIMGSLPRAKAGVGSAVNDTTRQVGGALGVAVIGSAMSSTYGPRIADTLSGTQASPADIEVAKESLGQALAFAARMPGATGGQLVLDAREAFVAGLHRGVIVAAAAAFIGAVVAARWLPARAPDADTFVVQDAQRAVEEREAVLTREH